MLRLAFDFIITWRETRTRPNAYDLLAFITACLMLAHHIKKLNKITEV